MKEFSFEKKEVMAKAKTILATGTVSEQTALAICVKDQIDQLERIYKTLMKGVTFDPESEFEGGVLVKDVEIDITDSETGEIIRKVFMTSTKEELTSASKKALKERFDEERKKSDLASTETELFSFMKSKYIAIREEMSYKGIEKDLKTGQLPKELTELCSIAVTSETKLTNP